MFQFIDLSKRLIFKNRFSYFILLANILLLSTSHAGFEHELISLNGEIKPGAMIVGNTDANFQVAIDDKPISLLPDGHFVFGLGRDARGHVKLSLTTPLDTFEWQLPIAQREYDIQHIEGIAKKYVEPDPKVTAWIQKDVATVKQARKQFHEFEYFLSGFIEPVKGRVTGRYGSQRYFNGQPRRPHYGIDIAAPKGTPVVAPADALVTMVEDNMYFSGGTLMLQHGYGVTTTFLHLDEILVEEGSKIKQGDVIGRVGSTGRSTGPHLDWRVNWYGERLDPELVTGLKPKN